MTPAAATRPVLFVLALSLAGCGVVEGDPHRFQAMGDRVAAIDVPLAAQKADAPALVNTRGGTGRFTPVHVSVMSPHEMWDARDAQAHGQKGALTRMAQPAVDSAIHAAAPAVAEAVVAQVAAPAEAKAHRTIQLGAFSSDAGARQAWSRLQTRAALIGLSPVFERVEIDGRSLTRLKVGPIPVETAADLCRAAQVADPWCRHAG